MDATPSQPASQGWPSRLAGLVIFVGSLAIERSLPDSGPYARWTNWALWVLAAAGLALLFRDRVVAAVRPLTGIRVRSPLYREPEVPDEIRALHATTTAIKAERERFASEREEIDARLKEAERKLLVAEHENRVLDSNNRKLAAELRYGTRPADMEPLDELDLRAAREHIAEMLPAIDSAHSYAMQIANLFLDRMESDQHSAEFYLSRFLREIIARCDRVFALLHETIEMRDDPRRALVMWYDRYHWLRNWVPRLARLNRITAPYSDAVPKYADWRKADAAFGDLFDRKMRVERLAAATSQIRFLNHHHNYRGEPLPE